ncbi:MAG: hypothetical protein Fur0037_27210 [Planctomycetota bacterium]
MNRPAILSLLVIAILASLGFLLVPGREAAAPRDDQDGSAIAARDASPRGAPGEAGAPEQADRPVDAAPGPIAASDRTAVDLADIPTAFLSVRDAESDLPIEGASVHALKGGEFLNFTDAEGECGVPLKKPAQLVVAADGYLLRLCPTQPGASSPEEPKIVRMQKDRCTLRCRFLFRAPDGSVPERVRAVFRPLGDRREPRVPAAILAGSAELKRAWAEHLMIANREAFTEMRVQTGLGNAARVHPLLGRDLVRFCEPGQYRIDAAAEGGLVGSAQFSAEQAVPEPVVIRLEPGRFADGIVEDAVSGRRVAGARVAPREASSLVEPAVTGREGSFRLGPLGRSAVALRIEHPDYEPVETGPVRPGEPAGTYALRPLVSASILGTVRARPRGEPVAGAAVSALLADGRSLRTASGADGSFSLRVPGAGEVRLTVAAPGYLAYCELVEPDGTQRNFDLWPESREERVRRGSTALLQGLVVDSSGLPVAGMSVRFVPDEPAPPRIPPDRRILAGGAPPLAVIVKAGSGGSFEIETDCEGGGVLVPMDGRSTERDGLRVAPARGRTLKGLRVRAAVE